MSGCSKKNEKIHREYTFNQMKEKPRLPRISANRPSNNWALGQTWIVDKCFVSIRKQGNGKAWNRTYSSDFGDRKQGFMFEKL